MPSYKNFGLTPSLEDATMFGQDGTTVEYNTATFSSAGEHSYTYNFQSFHQSLGQDTYTDLFVFDARKVNIVEVLFYLKKTASGPIQQSNYLAKYVATIGINEDFEGNVENEESIFYIEQSGGTAFGGNFIPNVGLISDPPHAITSIAGSPNIFNVTFRVRSLFLSTIRGIYQYI